MDIIEVAKKCSRKYGLKWVQFHRCNAYISDVIDDRYRLIKSYATVVGIADCDTLDVWEIGKYSQTTSKQVTQICNQVFTGYTRHYIDGRV
jgi:hypothetical protein